MTWGESPDVDLHAFEPNGSHVYYDNRVGLSGHLDHHDRDGYGPEITMRFTKSPSGWKGNIRYCRIRCHLHHPVRNPGGRLLPDLPVQKWRSPSDSCS